MLGSNIPKVEDDEGYLFVDRNPDKFEVVLEFLRTNRLYNFARFSMFEILSEFDYYSVDVSGWDIFNCEQGDDSFMALNWLIKNAKQIASFYVDNRTEQYFIVTLGLEDSCKHVNYPCNIDYYWLTYWANHVFGLSRSSIKNRYSNCNCKEFREVEKLFDIRQVN